MRGRIQGPYRHEKGWRVQVTQPDGGQKTVYFETEEQAKAAIKHAKLQLKHHVGIGEPIPGSIPINQPATESYCKAIAHATNRLLKDPENRDLQSGVRALCETAKASSILTASNRPLKPEDLGFNLKNPPNNLQELNNLLQKAIMLCLMGHIGHEQLDAVHRACKQSEAFYGAVGSHDEITMSDEEMLVELEKELTACRNRLEAKGNGHAVQKGKKGRRQEKIDWEDLEGEATELLG